MTSVSEPAKSGVRFAASRTTVWLGGTRMIPFEVVEPADVDRLFDVESTGASTLEVVRPPVALAGQALGFVRVRGVKAGEASLRVGDATLKVAVREDPVVPASERETRPVIVAPVSGAVVWGKIAVGVELDDDPADPAEVALLLPGGEPLPLVEEVGFEMGPTRRLSFELDADALPPGPLDLIAVMQRQGETERESERVTVDVVRPADGVLFAGEAESLRDMPRPPRYLRKDAAEQPKLTIGKGSGASGGEFVVNNGAFPPLVGVINIETPAWYQVILTVSGDFSSGAFPTVGLRVDNDNYPQTAGRLTQKQWHRLPVGRPVYLQPGERSLLAYFENDFNARGQDRNLRIDRFEVLRMESLPASEQVIALPGGDDRVGVALATPLHGRVVSGNVVVEAEASWDGRRQPDPPVVSLLVNGEVIAQQQDASPRFLLDRGFLRDGANTLRLEARLSSGLTARSPEARLTVAPFEGGSPQSRRVLSYPVFDAAWDDATRERLISERNREERVVGWYSNAKGALTLPDDLEGRFDVRFVAKGQPFEGDPVALVVVHQGDEERLRKEVKVSGGYRTFDAGAVDLAAGPKRIEVAFINDAFGGDAKRDRNLFLGGVTLRERMGRDETPPRATIVYPAPDAPEAASVTVAPVDAVVVDVADDREVAWAELLVDGEATGFRVAPAVGESRLVLPVVIRGEGRERTIAVRVADRAGNTSDTPGVAAAVDAGAETYGRAVRLLDRFAFGPEGDELAAVLTMGEEAYLRDRLFRRWDDPGEQAAWQRAALKHSSRRSGSEVERRALLWAMTTPNPVRARFALWTANHFSTWLRKAQAERKGEEFARFAAAGPSPFFQLLQTSATSPAMLYYLDQHRSFGRRINENYAREIMELHTVGVHGGYTQEDVTSLAHLLTGWMMTEEAPLHGLDWFQSNYRYVPHLNDADERVVFGLRLEEAKDPQARKDRVHRVIEMLAAHPSTANYICHKLVEHYVGVPAAPALVADLSAVFTETGGDLREVLLAMAKHEAFWASDPRVARPLDHAIRLSRAVRHESAGQVQAYLNRSALGLFDKDTPDGYPEEDEAYTDSNVTLQRWRLAADMDYRLLSAVPEPLRTPPGDEEDLPAWRQAVVDAAAMRLLGRPLGEASSKAVVRLMEDNAGTSAGELVRSVASLVAQMPEATLR